mgnify:CR=1 FL=1
MTELSKAQLEQLWQEAEKKVATLTAEVERLTSQVKIVEGLKSELAQQAEYHHHKHIELEAEVERMTKERDFNKRLLDELREAIDEKASAGR